MHTVLPCTTSYYKACTQYFPVLLRTTKLAQSTSQYDFILPNSRTTKLAQATSHYYFVLPSLQKVFPSIASYYKTCTKYFPSTTSYYKACTKSFLVLLRTTKLVQSTSQYYFVLQSLHKALQNHNFPQFLTIEPHFVRKGCARRLKSAILPAVFEDRTSFRAKRLRRTFEKRNDRTSFRAKELRRKFEKRNFTCS